MNLIITYSMEESHSKTDTGADKQAHEHSNVYCRLHNSPGENSNNETRCYTNLSTLKRINLRFITVGTPQGDVKSNSCVLLDARSKETQWILCSPPPTHTHTKHKTIKWMFHRPEQFKIRGDFVGSFNLTSLIICNAIKPQYTMDMRYFRNFLTNSKRFERIRVVFLKPEAF
jgi:hypothetical protein